MSPTDPSSSNSLDPSFVGKHITLFSSDATELYKADIFRVLALPSEHTIQFRYERQYVLEMFRENPSALIGREAVIFFLAGNDLQKKPEDRKLVPYPVRACTVRDSFLDKGTDQVILILDLREFVDCEIDSVTDRLRLPPHAFVGEAQLDRMRESSWIERVRSIESHFPDTVFYRIQGIMLENSVTKPSYSEAKRLSFYLLDEESEYSIECSCYDRGKGDTPLHIQCPSQDISLSNSFENGVRARLDTKRLPLTTRGLTGRAAPAEAVFFTGKSGAPSDPNRVNLYWRLVRKPWKSAAFGSLTFLAAIGLGLSQGSYKDNSGNLLSICDVLTRLFGAVLVGIAAAQLFRFFNKT